MTAEESGFTQAMKDRLAMRLLMRPDRSDSGELLPRTEAALALPRANAEEGAKRVEQLVEALAEERLIVPITVEAPPESDDHKPLDPNAGPLKAVAGASGSTLVAFSSAEELRKWDPEGRPMTMKSYRVAVGALAQTETGTITLNPASTTRTVIPRSAVLALSSGDSWLPAWEDGELRTELAALAKQELPAIVNVAIRPTKAYGGSGWDGGVTVELLMDTELAVRAADGNEPVVRARLGKAIEAVTTYARLRESAQQIEIVPRPVASL